MKEEDWGSDGLVSRQVQPNDRNGLIFAHEVSRMPTRIALEDSRLFPVQAFFNAVSDDSFVRVIRSLKNHVGHCIEDCDCSFPGDLDPTDESFDGVLFSLFEDEVVISLDELSAILEVACRAQALRVPNQKQAIEAVLDQQ